MLNIGLFTFALLCALTSNAQTKSIQDSTFTVHGVCNMCEKRIEKAALIKGVMSAEWDRNTQTLKVIYKSKKASVSQVKEAVVAVGHDTDSLKATDAAYAELPDCCAYRDGVEVH